MNGCLKLIPLLTIFKYGNKFLLKQLRYKKVDARTNSNVKNLKPLYLLRFNIIFPPISIPWHVAS